MTRQPAPAHGGAQGFAVRSTPANPPRRGWSAPSTRWRACAGPWSASCRPRRDRRRKTTRSIGAPSIAFGVVGAIRRRGCATSPGGARLQAEQAHRKRWRAVCRIGPAARCEPVLFQPARPPQLSRARHNASHPRPAPAGRFDCRQAADALASAAGSARSADRAGLCLSRSQLLDSSSENRRQKEFNNCRAKGQAARRSTIC